MKRTRGGQNEEKWAGLFLWQRSYSFFIRPIARKDNVAVDLLVCVVCVYAYTYTYTHIYINMCVFLYV